MAIDYGRKRCGVAVTDTLRIAANGLATVPTYDLLSFIKDYVTREQVFMGRLKKELPQVEIVTYDERFTSSIAHRAMLDGGMKKSDRRDKARVDTIAATIILTDYLQSIYNI